MSERNIGIDELKRVATEHHGEIIDMSIGSPKFPTDLDARTLGAKSPQNDYPLTRGSEWLRSAGVDWIKREYPDLAASPDSDTVAATNGSKGAVGIIPAVMRHKFGTDKVGLVPEIGYPTYFDAPDYYGLEVEKYPLTDEGVIDLDKLFELDSEKFSYLIINSPHNPTGGTMDLAAYNEIAAYAKRTGIWVFSDESYQSHIWSEDPKKQGQTMLAHAHHAPVVSLFSPSKTYSAAGLRTGLIAGDQEIVQAMWNGAKTLGSIASAASQTSYMHLLDRHEEIAGDLREKYKQRLEIIVSSMANAARVGIEFDELSMPEGGLYVWAKSKDESQDGSDIALTLAQNLGLVVSPGHTFGKDSRTKAHVRIAAVADDHGMDLLQERTAA